MIRGEAYEEEQDFLALKITKILKSYHLIFYYLFFCFVVSVTLDESLSVCKAAQVSLAVPLPQNAPFPKRVGIVTTNAQGFFAPVSLKQDLSSLSHLVFVRLSTKLLSRQVLQNKEAFLNEKKIQDEVDTLVFLSRQTPRKAEIYFLKEDLSQSQKEPRTTVKSDISDKKASGEEKSEKKYVFTKFYEGNGPLKSDAVSVFNWFWGQLGYNAIVVEPQEPVPGRRQLLLVGVSAFLLPGEQGVLLRDSGAVPLLPSVSVAPEGVALVQIVKNDGFFALADVVFSNKKRVPFEGGQWNGFKVMMAAKESVPTPGGVAPRQETAGVPAPPVSFVPQPLSSGQTRKVLIKRSTPIFRWGLSVFAGPQLMVSLPVTAKIQGISAGLDALFFSNTQGNSSYFFGGASYSQADSKNSFQVHLEQIFLNIGFGYTGSFSAIPLDFAQSRGIWGAHAAYQFGLNGKQSYTRSDGLTEHLSLTSQHQFGVALWAGVFVAPHIALCLGAPLRAGSFSQVYSKNDVQSVSQYRYLGAGLDLQIKALF